MRPPPEPRVAGPSGSLRALQETLLAGLTAHAARLPAALRGALREPARGTLDARWEIYTSGYLARLVEALENDFPALRRILGEGAFTSLGARYVRACPPRSHDLGRAGDRLAAFLETDALGDRLPFLSDLARYEWAVSEAFVAPDVEALGWDDLAGLGAEAAADLRLRLRPGTRLVRSRWPLFDLSDARDLADEDVSIPIEGRPCNALVFRRELEVLRRALDDDDARLLEELQAGRSLASLAAARLDEDTGAARLVERFRALVAEGVFARPQMRRRGAQGGARGPT